MKQKQILYLSYTGLTEPLGQSQVLAYLQGLSVIGLYKFTVISFEHPEYFKRNKESIERSCADADIEWHPLPYEKINPVLATIKRVLAIKKKAFLLHNKKSFDLVHCRSYRASLIGLWLKQKKGVPFIFDMRGFWADERIEGGIWNLKNPVYRFLFAYFKRKEKVLLRKADGIVSLTENAKNEILKWKLTGQPLPISVIPCCVDIELFNPSVILPEEQEALRNDLNILPENEVISYLGSLGTWYLLDEMLQFFACWYKQNNGAIILFITNETAVSILSKSALYKIPESAIRIISVKRVQVPLALSLSKYSLFFIKPSFSKKASSPVKQGEIMAMGIPVICNSKVGDTDKIVFQYHSGYVVNQLEPGGFENEIKKICLQNYDNKEIQKGAQSYFSLEKGVQLYHQVYQDILLNVS
jgi:glycosyltransferase involved in cell wall biosynthesis